MTGLKIKSNGLEVKLNSYDDLQTAQSALVHQIGGKADQNGNPYSVISIKENPRTISMLSWLDLLDVNVLVILIIMVIVGGFTMVSGLLILILERTRTIGILKALGATNTRIRHTFLWFASFIISRGLVIGNAIAFLFNSPTVLVSHHTPRSRNILRRCSTCRNTFRMDIGCKSICLSNYHTFVGNSKFSHIENTTGQGYSVRLNLKCK